MRINNLKLKTSTNIHTLWEFRTINNRLGIIIYDKFDDVVYTKIGYYHQNSCGLCFYGPLIVVKNLPIKVEELEALTEVEKLIKNVPEELLDMLLKLKGY